MKIEIKNCNSIDYANISIKENTLNIKYGINGTGKTTISKAIQYATRDDRDELFNILIPFKHRKNQTEDNIPKVSGIDNFKTVLLFNEEYVNNFVFLEDEILKDSFEVFLKNEKFDKAMNEIEMLINDVSLLFKDDQQLNELIKCLRDLSLCFGKSTKNGYSAASSVGKGLKDGNKIVNIPEELKVYKDYLNSADNSKWLKWHIAGKEYMDLGCSCPYCTSEIVSKKQTILKVAEEYDSKTIEHLNKVLDKFERLKDYFTEDTNDKITEITQSIDGISKEKQNYLLQIKEQVDIFLEKLDALSQLSYFKLRNSERVIDELNKYKIDIEYLHHLDTFTTKKKIDDVNLSLDNVIKQAGRLQGEINKQNSMLLKNIGKYKDEINNFLKYSGYNYYVEFQFINEKYRMLLHHKNISDSIKNAKMHLSYGEKNAFALILFMYEAVSKPADLIILDDPISSFDRNKKFAVINKLFKGEHSLRNKTILMLTHDFDPIVDMLRNFTNIFNEITPNACFLENRHGVIFEKEIKKEDIKTFIQIAEENIKTLNNDLNKLIYLRRLYEIKNSKGNEWELLSNLFHKRKKPIFNSKKDEEGNFIKMSKEEIEEAVNNIREEYIPNFNYDAELDKVLSEDTMRDYYNKSESNYEKLQIYRIINQENNSSNIIKKFINETYHVNNDYLFQLNPCKYEIIPEYIIEECNEDLRRSSKLQLV